MNNLSHDNTSASLFESIKRVENDVESWNARDLMNILSYTKWQKFKNVIELAQENLETITDDISQHFLPVQEITNGRPRLDYKLSLDAVKEIKRIASRHRPVKNRTEKSVRVSLLKTIPFSKTEVKTLAGNIDILTVNEIIEVKKVENWKHAVGQVLIYSHYYPSYQKRIHLFGETQQSFLAMIKRHCDKLKIKVTWEL
jgi:phage anti-repressor protein